MHDSGKGQACPPLQPLGFINAKRHEASHCFSQRSEVLTDTNMIEGLNDDEHDLEELLADDKPVGRTSPSPPLDGDEVDYDDDDPAEVFFTSDETFIKQAAQISNNCERGSIEKAQADGQPFYTEGGDIEAQAQIKAQANDQTILKENGDNKAQALADPALGQILQAEQEQPILTQQKVVDLIMQQQALSNNTSGIIMASTWATKKQGFTDMLSGFRSPTGTT
jgi:hypothetical protein